MRINSRGQVTIPAALRKQAGLRPTAKIEIDFDGNYIRIRPATRRSKLSMRRLIERMRGRGDVPMTTDEIMMLMRGE